MARAGKQKLGKERKRMIRKRTIKKTIAAATAAAVLTIGASGVAMAAPQDTTQATGGQQQTKQEQQDPNIKGTIAVPETKGEQDPATEAQQLSGLAKIDQKAAEDAALAALPGTVVKTDLGNENGFAVYNVEIKGSDGTVTEMKVDAGNGQVLAHEKGVDAANESPSNEVQVGGASGR